jgi:hypothetical protein
MVDHERIRNILDDYFWMSDDAQVTISEEGLVSVVGGVNMKRSASKLPCGFDVVNGSFFCSDQGLTTLAGAPRVVTEDFGCHHNRLTTLEGGPTSVGGKYNCHGQNVVSLEGLPQTQMTRLFVQYTPTLPLLRALVAEEIWLDASPNMTALESLTTISRIEKILNDTRWVGQGRRGVFGCKKALIEAGFEGNARW